MKSAEIRDRFLKFFEERGHTIVPSSPLVPGNDPTLLFTNSGHGAVQGRLPRPARSARTCARPPSQRCVRAGGKHNDLENVGYTARHHTFFEMLGNFSFGDYFKRDAIRFAWELLTKVYELPTDKLWTTVYHDDDEAYDIWTKEIGVPTERVMRIGDKKGAAQVRERQLLADGRHRPLRPVHARSSTTTARTSPAARPARPDADGDRYIEIWNLVFMQFNRDETAS